MDLDIKGKRALFLAASGGLGFATALALSQEGVQVAVSGSSKERAEVAATKISNKTGNKAFGLEGNLADVSNMDDLAINAKEVLGGNIDILLLNHGGPPIQSALAVTPENLEAQAIMMIYSQIRITQALVPAMIDQKWGRIILVGSGAIAQPTSGNILTNMYRNAMAQYCKTLANEVIQYGITVNVVSPSAVLTSRTSEIASNAAAKNGTTVEEELEYRKGNLPSARFGDTKEFSGMVAFLCSRYGGYSTGANFRVDGGVAKAL